MTWYNYDKINSYNCCFNFILTNRGFGKSYGSKKMAIRNFIKKGLPLQISLYRLK